jgi:competence ComEA-like helix-hairpin-helix protein
MDDLNQQIKRVLYQSQATAFKRQITLYWLNTVFLLLLSSPLSAQQQDSIRTQVERDIERAVESIDPEDSGTDPEEIAVFLQELAGHPLNINRATVDELLQVPGLNFDLARSIVQYRSDSSPFETLGDLLNVIGLGEVTLSKIQPYITIGSGAERGRDLFLNPKYWTRNGRFETFSRYQQVLEKQEGYLRPDSLGGYLGNPGKYYQRFRYTSSHLSLNLTQEKDPGEQLAGLSGFDYNGWHIAMHNNGILKDLIIGDYSVGFGQGLLLWSGGAFGKGRDVTGSVSKNDRGIRPYTSAQESNAFRGIALTIGNRLQFTGFYSNRNRTASLIDPYTTRSPNQTGYHRTLNERERKNSLGQETYGGRILGRISNGYLGVSGYFNRFDKTIITGNQAYEVHNFEGTEAGGASADFRLLFGPVQFFGEAAYSSNGGYGIVTGSELSIDASTSLALTYRYYDPAFRSFYGSAFGEQSGTPGNEEGFYFGLAHSISNTLHISTYFDLYRFPAARFRTHQPTSGYDWMGLIEYIPFKKLSVYAQIRHKSRELEFVSSGDFGREVRLLGNDNRTGARIQAGYRVHPSVRLRTRFELVQTNNASSDNGFGTLIFQDIRLTPLPAVTLDARVTVFDTDGFDSRVYQFENDLLYVMSNSILFDRGQRMYALIKYEASEWITFWLKIAVTTYENRNVISSGLNEIKGNRRSDIGIQARLRF